MAKKSVALVVIIMITLLVASTVVFAETATQWSKSYYGVQFKYINKFGGSDWDTLRWHNANSYKVAVTYSIRLSNGSTTNNRIYLGAGETSGDSSLAAGARVATISVKSVR